MMAAAISTASAMFAGAKLSNIASQSAELTVNQTSDRRDFMFCVLQRISPEMALFVESLQCRNSRAIGGTTDIRKRAPLP